METAIIGHSFLSMTFQNLAQSPLKILHFSIQNSKKKLLRNLEEKSVSDPLCLDEVVVTLQFKVVVRVVEVSFS